MPMHCVFKFEQIVIRFISLFDMGKPPPAAMLTSAGASGGP